jgi:hypothetical protein
MSKPKAYKIPSDEEVLTAIQRVITKHHTISSQTRLKNYVEGELKSLDKGYRVSGLRIRRLALKSKYFHLEIDYKHPPILEEPAKEPQKPEEGTGKTVKNSVAVKKTKGRKKKKEPKLNACPVCGSKVKKIKNKTLKGGSVTAGFKCTMCPYHTSLPVRIPAKYTFSIRRL